MAAFSTLIRSGPDHAPVPQSHPPRRGTGRRPDSLQIPDPASTSSRYRPAGGGQRNLGLPGWRQGRLDGGRNDVAVEQVERVCHRSISIGEVTMNAQAHVSGTTQRPSMAYRQLVMRGLAPGEAANLTAVMRGIPLGETPWTVREINHLLFLRAMREAGRFDPDLRVG